MTVQSVFIAHIFADDQHDGVLEVFSTHHGAQDFVRQWVIENWDYDTFGDPDDYYDVIYTYEINRDGKGLFYNIQERPIDKITDYIWTV